MSLELHARYTSPTGSVTWLRGPIWIPGETADQDARAFGYAPGPWFADPVWRRYNSAVSLVGEGLLRLRSSDNDRWALLIGGCIAPLARMNGYEPRVLRVDRLLARSGLLRADPRNPGRRLEKLERALDRLQEVGVLGRWEYLGTSAAEPDMDNADDLSALADAADRRHEQRILLSWPKPLQERARRLGSARKAHRPDPRR
jgi:hypothetical protein